KASQCARVLSRRPRRRPSPASSSRGWPAAGRPLSATPPTPVLRRRRRPLRSPISGGSFRAAAAISRRLRQSESSRRNLLLRRFLDSRLPLRLQRLNEIAQWSPRTAALRSVSVLPRDLTLPAL